MSDNEEKGLLAGIIHLLAQDETFRAVLHSANPDDEFGRGSEATDPGVD